MLHFGNMTYEMKPLDQGFSTNLTRANKGEEEIVWMCRQTVGSSWPRDQERVSKRPSCACVCETSSLWNDEKENVWALSQLACAVSYNSLRSERENSELRHLQGMCSQECVASLSLAGLQQQYGWPHWGMEHRRWVMTPGWQEVRGSLPPQNSPALTFTTCVWPNSWTANSKSSAFLTSTLGIWLLRLKHVPNGTHQPVLSNVTVSTQPFPA